MLTNRNFVALAALMSNCVLSIDPIVSESEAIFDPRLLGAWEEVAGSARALVTSTAPNTYHIEYAEEGETGTFEARLGRLANRLVLDIRPLIRDDDLPGAFADLMVAGHWLVELDVSEGEIRMAALERDSLSAAVQKEQVRLPYSRSGDRLILHGTTEEIRPALASYMTRPGALAKLTVWRRAPGAGASIRK